MLEGPGVKLHMHNVLETNEQGTRVRGVGSTAVECIVKHGDHTDIFFFAGETKESQPAIK